MNNKSDILSFIGLIAAFGGNGTIEGFTPQIHDLVCFVPTTCQIEVWILALLKLATGAAGIVAGYYLLRKVSTPTGSTLSIMPHNQIPVTAPKNGINGPSYSPINSGGSAAPVAITAPKGATP